jgi:hypothetical protein
MDDGPLQETALHLQKEQKLASPVPSAVARSCHNGFPVTSWASPWAWFTWFVGIFASVCRLLLSRNVVAKKKASPTTPKATAMPSLSF